MNKENIIVSAEVKTYLRDLYSQIEYELREDYKDGLEKALQQIDQLTNNWNELEEWLEESKKICKENDNNIGVNFINIVLDKMKEIKEGNNENK